MESMTQTITGEREPENARPPMDDKFVSLFEAAGVRRLISIVLRSSLARRRASSVFNFCVAVFGKDVVREILVRKFKETAEDQDVKAWLVDGSVRPSQLPASIEREIMASEFPNLAGQPPRLDELDDDTSRRLAKLRDTFGFGPVATDIVAFFLLMQITPVVDEYFNTSGDGPIGNFSDGLMFRSHGSSVIGIDRAELIATLESSVLYRSRLFELHNNGRQLVLADWCVRYLCGSGRDDIGAQFISRENSEPLEPEDFDIAVPEREVIEGILKSGKPANILLYGTPGTGKTSYIRSIARKYGKELLTVRMPEDDSTNDRMAAIYAALNIARKEQSIVLVDEADDLLNTDVSWRGSLSTAKSWVNTQMDSHSKTVVWITNRTSAIDPSTMRRFLFSMEFKKFDPRKRMKVLKYELEKRNLAESYFSEAELESLCGGYAVNAAGIVGAIGVALDGPGAAREEILARIHTILRNHEKAIGGRGERHSKKRGSDYTLEGLNASVSLHILLDGAKRYCIRTEKPGELERPYSMLLHGMPGTGKSEFVYHLGGVLDREVLLKRASDIKSKYVGETERNIAAAFSEARETGSVLFFDEADTFLFPRSSSHHSWEISFTNEILTQLENHNGVVVFATNDVEGLDHAALRRFRFKVRFDPLTPDGTMLLYRSLLLPMTGEKDIPPSVANQLRTIINLTPGDYAVVRDQFSIGEAGTATHDELIASLANEVNHKGKMGKIIGF